MKSDSKHTLRHDAHSQINLVGTMAKCEAPGIVLQLCEMLQYAVRFADYEIYEALWVIGDTSAESNLLRRFHKVKSGEWQGW